MHFVPGMGDDSVSVTLPDRVWLSDGGTYGSAIHYNVREWGSMM